MDKNEREGQQIDLINSKLAEINTLIKPYKLAYVSIKNDCEFLERNAHYMEKEVFEKLVQNIKEDGFLSQLPFAMKKPNGKYMILSGNHRVKASLKSGIDLILILYVEDLPRDKQLAYQLSHNALVGKDDMKMLKELFQETENIDMKAFSGLNDLSFIEADKINLPSINEDDIELQELKLIFVKSKANKIHSLFEALEKLKIEPDSRFIIGDFKEFIKLLTEVKKLYGVKSLSVGFVKMMEICDQYVQDRKAEMELKNN